LGSKESYALGRQNDKSSFPARLHWPISPYAVERTFCYGLLQPMQHFDMCVSTQKAAGMHMQKQKSMA
jgi:hypothetical protein